MADLENLTPESKYFALFVGDSGSGKKAAACSFPKPMRYFDFDGRVRGLLGAPWVERKGIDHTYYPPKSGSLQATQTVFERLNKDLEIIYINCQTGQNQFKTLYIGSLTGEAFAFLMDAIPLTHGVRSDGKKAGRTLGPLRMTSPDDFNFQSTGIHQCMAFLKSLPIPNIIVAGHTVPVYKKEDPENPYSSSIQVGTKLSLTEKLSAAIPGYFDNIVEFKKEEGAGGQNNHYCRFKGGIARSTMVTLPDGWVDITNKNFYNSLSQHFSDDFKAEIEKAGKVLA